jgi:hypothetical protein
MDPNQKLVSAEFASLIPVLAETMKFATQALAQSTAVYEVMIAKKIATKEELQAAMSSTQETRGKLLKMLDENWKTQA